MSEYYASRRRRNVHPKAMEQYRREWSRQVAEHDRKARWAFERLEDAIRLCKEDDLSIAHLGWIRKITRQAKGLEHHRLEVDKYQRLLDGRPTLTEERDARCREFEARMNAEYRREVSGGWADDEYGAQYDDVRERYHSMIGER